MFIPFRLVLLVTLICFAYCVHAQHVFKGKWICGTEDVTVRQAPVFRKEFQTSAARRHYGDGMRIKKATLLVAGLGLYELHVNGKRVSDAVLEQAFTRYDKRVLYNTYDVTRLLVTGKNCIGIELGNGWFNVQSKTIWGFDRVGWRKSPRFLLDLVLEYRNGRTEVISSDSSWKWSTGGSQFNSLIAGEIYDAGKEPLGWKTDGFEDKKWFSAMVASPPDGVPEAQAMPPVRVIRKLRPVSVKRLSGSYLYDFGQNFAGVVELRVSGRAGDTVVMQHSEKLNADGSFDALQNAGHMIGGASDPKFATDVYVLRGSGREVFRPRFTYHGFRYLLVRAPGHIRFDLGSVSGLFYSTDFKPAGFFSSSSEMLNKLHAAAIQSYRSNYVGIPTDCPQREKMGWLADAHVISELGLYNFDAASGYRKFLADIRDVQLEDGRLPGVAPTSGIGYNWIDPDDRDMGPAWGSALPILAWNVYRFSGDTSVLRENYLAVKKYVDFLAGRARASGYLYRTGLADFLAVESTPKAFTSTIFVFEDAVLLSKIAAVLGHSSDEQRYALLADSVKTAFNREFFDVAAGKYKVRTLTALSGALVNGLVPSGFEAAVAADLAAGVAARDYAPDFGVLGTKWVLSALSDHGYADEAFRLLANPNAGWGKWIADGHTTLLEGWEPKDQSWNHVFFGDFDAWYYRGLAGIRPHEALTGFKRFSVSPVFPAGLNWISVKHDTRFGAIELRWKRRKAGISVEVLVPEGTVAEFKVKGYERELGPGRHRIKIKLN